LRSNHAPINDAKIAGMPNFNKTGLSVFLPTRAILKRLFEKCTTPVNAIAISMGKNIANTGANIVPSPKPEKNVRVAVKKAAKLIITISIKLQFFYFLIGDCLSSLYVIDTKIDGRDNSSMVKFTGNMVLLKIFTLEL